MEKLSKTVSAKRASTVNVKYVRPMNPSVTGVMVRYVFQCPLINLRTERGDSANNRPSYGKQPPEVSNKRFPETQT